MSVRRSSRSCELVWRSVAGSSNSLDTACNGWSVGKLAVAPVDRIVRVSVELAVGCLDIFPQIMPSGVVEHPFVSFVVGDDSCRVPCTVCAGGVVRSSSDNCKSGSSSDLVSDVNTEGSTGEPRREHQLLTAYKFNWRRGSGEGSRSSCYQG